MICLNLVNFGSLSSWKYLYPLLSLYRSYFICILQKMSKILENTIKLQVFKKAENMQNKQADIL